MSSFRTLQARHEELINQAQAGQDIVDEVQTFIDEVKASSSQIGASRERDQLRSNLRYWASYIYEHTRTYPNVDLAPSNVRPQPNWILPAVIGILVLAGIAFVTSRLLNPNTTVPNPTSGPAQTEFPTLPPESATATLPPAATSTLAAIAPTQGNVISIQLTSVQNGDQVPPVTQLSGTYSNLRAGYSIHVIVQPQSKGGIQFPMPQYALVDANSPSGEWAIEGRFGQGQELTERETYSISLVAAVDETARQELLDSVETGFQELPAGVIPFPQSVSVSRGAISAIIDGVRLIYSSYLDEEGNFEIFSSDLDGSDLRRITNNSAISEMYPSLSPDGTKIAYVGRRRDEDNRPVYSVEILNSDGTSPTTIVEPQEGVLYERPLWSGDGDFIAYVTGNVSDSRTIWSIWVYDLALGESKPLIEGNKSGPRYIAWIPDSHDLVFDSRIPATGTSGFRTIDISTPGDPSTYFDKTGEELQPAVSPDGSLLAYMQLDNTIGNIYVADLANGSIKQLTQNQFTGSSPVWAPDGETIFFQFFGDGFYNIWSVTMDTEPVQVTFGKDQYPNAGYMYALIP